MKRTLYFMLTLISASTLHAQSEMQDPSNDLIYSMLTLVQAKIKSVSASDALYTTAKKGYNAQDEVAQNIDEAATEFIACLTQEIQIEQFTLHMMKTKSLSPATHHLLEELYQQIPTEFKKSSIHRSATPLAQRLLDSIAQADEQTLAHLYEFLATKYKRAKNDFI